jgi:hypothetical protein
MNLEELIIKKFQLPSIYVNQSPIYINRFYRDVVNNIDSNIANGYFNSLGDVKLNFVIPIKAFVSFYN